MTTPQENRRNWHIDKTINPSHLLTSLTIVITGAWYILGMQTQIDLGRAQSKVNQDRIQRIEVIQGEGNGPLRRDIDRIQADVEKINVKLDVMNEKLSQQPPRTRYLKDYQ